MPFDVATKSQVFSLEDQVQFDIDSECVLHFLFLILFGHDIIQAGHGEI
jgi:hypothetical protein